MLSICRQPLDIAWRTLVSVFFFALSKLSILGKFGADSICEPEAWSDTNSEQFILSYSIKIQITSFAVCRITFKYNKMNPGPSLILASSKWIILQRTEKELLILPMCHSHLIPKAYHLLLIKLTTHSSTGKRLTKQMYLFLTQEMEASRVEDLSQRQDCKLESHSRKNTWGALSKNETNKKQNKIKNT